ncbi:16S rRNA (guanine(966)-N(2))-methyltransferase RsmD [Roseibacillus persicicus]|uniref:16S rRNA (guanine(966)-N(2))-methyltransferase RsmD n=1 Tax=Roseibacillus persicicus TaxID=454148 RepID=UPI00398AA413
MRIIAGTHRGTRLKEPANVTRPTSDRVREAIFNVLRHVVPEAKVLDLFAGTGALGLEALSRGSKSCTFVEMDAQALRCLRDNLAHTKFPEGRIVESDVFRFLEKFRDPQPYDLIFADPPYFRNGSADLAGPLLSEPLPLAHEGILVLEVESERTTPEDLPYLNLVKRKDYGKTSILYFEYQQPA